MPPVVRLNATALLLLLLPVLLLLLAAACSEGILWHVLTTPIKISQDLLTKYQEAVGDVYCPDKEEGEKKKKGDDKKDVMPMANGTYFQLPPTDKSE